MVEVLQTSQNLVSLFSLLSYSGRQRNVTIYNARAQPLYCPLFFCLVTLLLPSWFRKLPTVCLVLLPWLHSSCTRPISSPVARAVVKLNRSNVIVKILVIASQILYNCRVVRCEISDSDATL